MIQCIQSSGWTGYMLMKVRQDFLEVGLVKVPGVDEGSVRCLLLYLLSSSWSLDKAKIVSACGEM